MTRRRVAWEAWPIPAASDHVIADRYLDEPVRARVAPVRPGRRARHALRPRRAGADRLRRRRLGRGGARRRGGALVRDRLQRGLRRARLRPPRRPLVPGRCRRASAFRSSAGGCCAARPPPTPRGSRSPSAGWPSASPPPGSRPIWPCSPTSPSAPGRRRSWNGRCCQPAGRPGRPSPATASGCSRPSARPRSARLEPPPGLAAWLERAAAGGFAALPDCLDDLERCGDPGDADPDAARPPGLERLFDEDFDLDGVIAPPPRPRPPAGCSRPSRSSSWRSPGRSCSGPRCPPQRRRRARRTGPRVDDRSRSHRRRRRPARPRREPQAGRPSHAPSGDAQAPPHGRASPRTQTTARHRRTPRPPSHDHPRRPRPRPPAPSTGAVDAPGARRHDAAARREREPSTMSGCAPRPACRARPVRPGARGDRRNAYAPYSRFAVGAALQPAGGAEPIIGVNVENASYGLTIVRRAQRRLRGRRRGPAPASRPIAVHAEAASAPAVRRVPAGAGRVRARRSPSSTAAAARSSRRPSTSCCPSASSCERRRAPLGPGGAGRAAERRQVDAREPPGRRARRGRLGAGRRPPGGGRSASSTGPGCQLVMVDLPGFQKPFDRLTERMQRSVNDDAGRRRRHAAHARRAARRSAPATATSPSACSRPGAPPCVDRRQQDRRPRRRPGRARRWPRRPRWATPHAVHPISAPHGRGRRRAARRPARAPARGAGLVPGRDDDRPVRSSTASPSSCASAPWS